MLMIWKETPFYYSFPSTVLYYLSIHSGRVPWLLAVTKQNSLTLITNAEESCPLTTLCHPETSSESAGCSLNFCFPCTSFSSFEPPYPEVFCSCASLLSEGDKASASLHAGCTATKEVRKLDYYVLIIIFRGSDGAWWFALVLSYLHGTPGMTLVQCWTGGDPASSTRLLFIVEQIILYCRKLTAFKTTWSLLFLWRKKYL